MSILQVICNAKGLCCETQDWSLGKTDPILLEAVLGTKEAILDPELQTCWALERSSIVFAVGAQTLALRRRFLGHDGRLVLDLFVLGIIV